MRKDSGWEIKNQQTIFTIDLKFIISLIEYIKLNLHHLEKIGNHYKNKYLYRYPYYIKYTFYLQKK